MTWSIWDCTFFATLLDFAVVDGAAEGASPTCFGLSSTSRKQIRRSVVARCTRGFLPLSACSSGDVLSVKPTPLPQHKDATRLLLQ